MIKVREMKRHSDEFYSYEDARSRVQALGIFNSRDYAKRYMEDTKLPANPHKVYFNIGWSTWDIFLCKSKFYETYAEAKAAARALNCSGMKHYKKARNSDVQLPSHPEVVYENDWEGWGIFVGTREEGWYTYEEASQIVQRMGITTSTEYWERFQTDERLPSNPNTTYKHSGWKNWGTFLNTLKLHYFSYSEAQKIVQQHKIAGVSSYKELRLKTPGLPADPAAYYPTDWKGSHSFYGTTPYTPDYEVAKKAALDLGIKTEAEYRRRYKENLLLPRCPHKCYTYSWMGYPNFLDQDPKRAYSSYVDARSAVRMLGIRTSKEYSKYYKRDLHLPSAPDQYYSNTGWKSWAHFLGNEEIQLYDYTEASAATQRLGIKSKSEYERNHYLDPRLPSAPSGVYAGLGWQNWYEYTGRQKEDYYPTYQEAEDQVRKMGIKSYMAYYKRHFEDLRLPKCPFKTYANKGWKGWGFFVGTADPHNVKPAMAYPMIWKEVEAWLDNERNLARKTSSLRDFIKQYCKPLNLPDDPFYPLSRKNEFSKETYCRFINTQAGSLKSSTHSSVVKFYDYLLNKCCSSDGPNGDVLRAGFRNPFMDAFSDILDTLAHNRPSQSTKPPLGYEYIIRALEFLVPNGDQSMQTQPNLGQLLHLQSFFYSRTDWIEVDKEQIDHSDPNCIFRTIEVTRLVGKFKRRMTVYQIWSPARFIALYTLLRYPLRGVQILLLDSGEADEEIPKINLNTHDIDWCKNDCSLFIDKHDKRPPQGAIQKGAGGAPILYVTTNKTGCKEGGYIAEWLPDDLIYWFLFLRDWQHRYNPISEPTRWTDISLRTKTNAKILKARGTQCFLFRDVTGKPLIPNTAFETTLPALLFKIQRDRENLAFADFDAGFLRYTSPYTPHSLRVSLITAWILDGGADIHIVSKLVGHSSIVMTLYYTVPNADQMRRAMGETEKRAAQIAAERQAEIIREKGLGPINSQLIATDGNRELLEGDVPGSACVVFDYGICPVSAALCHIGGVRVDRHKENIFSPVTTGHLGQKNCPHCRFFITGVPFLGGLVSLANEIALEANIESGRFQAYSAEVKQLEQNYYDACRTNAPDSNHSARKKAIANQQQSAGRLDSLVQDYSAVNHYVQSCLTLIKDDPKRTQAGDGIRLIISADVRDFRLVISESRNQYHLLAEICQNAAIYRSSNPSRALPLISQAIDRMVSNNGLPPGMFLLTDDQKVVVANELNQLLLQRLGSWERIDHLFSGELMLLDVDAHSPTLTNISTEIGSLFLRFDSSLPKERAIHE
jgi:hypothetical protein